jgi:cGMP-dependent protein kinase
MKKPLNYPEIMTDKTAKSIIEQFLNKTPEVRLGGSFT